MGRNGAGKSTLLASMVGQLAPATGTVKVGPINPAHTRETRETIVRFAGLVPQDPTLLLYADSVADECAAADRDFGPEPGNDRCAATSRSTQASSRGPTPA